MTHASRQPQPPGFPVTAARPGRDTPRLPASGCATARPAAGTAVRAAAAMTASTTIRKRLTVPGGRHDQAHAARLFTTAALPAHHPCAATAALLVSELVTNSMLHSDSRLPGGTITITVTGSPVPGRRRIGWHVRRRVTIRRRPEIEAVEPFPQVPAQVPARLATTSGV